MEDFTAEDKSELSVKLGDCVVVMAKDPSGTVVPVYFDLVLHGPRISKIKGLKQIVPICRFRLTCRGPKPLTPLELVFG